MNRKTFFTIAVSAGLFVAGAVWWLAYPHAGSPARVAPSISEANGPASASNAIPPSPPISAQLDSFRTRLEASPDPETSRRILAELRDLLGSLPPRVASREVQSFLASTEDAATKLDVTIEAGGGLGDASSLRVFMLDYLGRIDRQAAGAVAAQVLSNYTKPDEWAVSLRNYAWANPGAEGEAFLQAKARQLLGNADWLKEPSAGFLEAFDAIVYAHGTALLPDLTGIVRDKDNPAAAHAAFLTLDRLTIDAPATMLKQLVDQPEMMAGREQTRANLVARADIGEPTQRALVEQYLLDPARDPQELATFASLYPNANYMISNNLLTPVVTPTGEQIAAQDRAALKVIEQWQADPRFERLNPLLAQMHTRVAAFVH